MNELTNNFISDMNKLSEQQHNINNQLQTDIDNYVKSVIAASQQDIHNIDILRHGINDFERLKSDIEYHINKLQRFISGDIIDNNFHLIFNVLFKKYGIKGSYIDIGIISIIDNKCNIYSNTKYNSIKELSSKTIKECMELSNYDIERLAAMNSIVMLVKDIDSIAIKDNIILLNLSTNYNVGYRSKKHVIIDNFKQENKVGDNATELIRKLGILLSYFNQQNINSYMVDNFTISPSNYDFEINGNNQLLFNVEGYNCKLLKNNTLEIKAGNKTNELYSCIRQLFNSIKIYEDN